MLLLKDSGTQFQRCGRRVPTAPSKSLPPPEYPTIQLNSDTVYLEKCQILQFKGSVLHDCYALFRRQSWASDRPAIDLRFHTTPLLDLINLLEQLTKLRETLYLPDSWFIIKGCNMGTARWKRCIGQSMGKGHGASTVSPSMPLSLNLNMFTNLEALRSLSFWVFMEASLHRHDWLSPWSLVSESTSSPSPLPRGQGVGQKVPTL